MCAFFLIPKKNHFCCNNVNFCLYHVFFCIKKGNILISFKSIEFNQYYVNTIVYNKIYCKLSQYCCVLCSPYSHPTSGLAPVNWRPWLSQTLASPASFLPMVRSASTMGRQSLPPLRLWLVKRSRLLQMSGPWALSRISCKYALVLTSEKCRLFFFFTLELGFIYFNCLPYIKVNSI